MPSRAVDCQYRFIAGDLGPVCSMVEKVTGITDPAIGRTTDAICRTCQKDLRHGEPINSVIASLVYNAIGRIIGNGGHPECGLERAQWLRRCAADQVSLILDPLPDRVFPPARGTNAEAKSESQTPRLAVGMMTAPRRVPTIRQAMGSLEAAGFGEIHLFAEPDSEIPDGFKGVEIHRRKRRLGTMVNYYSGLAVLLEKYPEAEGFVMFQDDIEAALGLRSWIEGELWPGGAGIVSMFTPRPHLGSEPGWKLHSPGYQRVCGAQGMIVRRDVLERFLSDSGVLFRLQSRRMNNDAVLAGWAAWQGLPIAYHSPSLVGHIGEVSSLYEIGPDRRNFSNAIAAVDEIANWVRPVRSDTVRIGLAGSNIPTGVGYQNRDFARHGGMDRWLITHHPRSLESQDCGMSEGRIQATGSQRMDDAEVREWVDGLDWLLFVEAPRLRNLVRVAAQSGVGIACVPNWEWIQPGMAWLSFVDVMLCPTRHTFALMNDWKSRYGFGWRTVLFPWPIDTEQFHFHERRICRRFLFVNGWGGSKLRYPNGGPVSYRRKGIDTILETARLAPRLSFVIRSQESINEPLPDNIELLESPAAHGGLYTVGDVCVQPSRFEGLGLQLLECQAAGLPLVTTDAPPMNEHHPFRTVPTCGYEVVDTGPGPVFSNQIDPSDLAALLESLVGADIAEESRRARAFVEREHSWSRANELLRSVLTIR